MWVAGNCIHSCKSFSFRSGSSKDNDATQNHKDTPSLSAGSSCILEQQVQGESRANPWSSTLQPLKAKGPWRGNGANGTTMQLLPCCPFYCCCCKSPLYVPSDLVQRPSTLRAMPKTTWWATSSLTKWIRLNLNLGHGTVTSASSSKESVSWPCQVFCFIMSWKTWIYFIFNSSSFCCQHITSGCFFFFFF